MPKLDITEERIVKELQIYLHESPQKMQAP
jgi:hypothetical protein